MCNYKVKIDWFLGDGVAIQYQVHRNLPAIHRPDLRRGVVLKGWGAEFRIIPKTVKLQYFMA